MKLRLFLKKNLVVLCIILAIAVFIGSVVMFLFGFTARGYQRVFRIIIGAILLILSVLIFVYAYFSRDCDPNFFLYDRRRYRNIPPEELTFTQVNERMTFFLTCIVDKTEMLWTMNMLEDESKMGYQRVYRPLLAYKMIYDCVEKNTEEFWNYLFNAPYETIDSLCSALEQGGESDMPSALRYLVRNFPNDHEKIKGFLTGNLKYIRSRMVAYVRRNVELFY